MSIEYENYRLVVTFYVPGFAKHGAIQTTDETKRTTNIEKGREFVRELNREDRYSRWVLLTVEVPCEITDLEEVE